MFTTTDHDRLLQIMDESPEKKELLTQLLESHRMNLSMISHELRNPLTMVYSALQLIEAQHPEVTGFKHWKEMRQDVEYMNLLLTDLSSYNNGQQLSLTPLDMADFLGKLSLSFASSITDTGIEFTSRILPGLPTVLGDPVKLRQVLLNLLLNARDALAQSNHTDPSTKDGPSARSIRLDACADRDQLIIRISDTGCGISPDIMDTIFDPFVTYKANGTGMGLAIASRIITAHKGQLRAESPSGGPTVFTVLLPIQQQPAQETCSQSSQMGGIVHTGTGEAKVEAEQDHDHHAPSGDIADPSPVPDHHIQQSADDPEDRS